MYNISYTEQLFNTSTQYVRVDVAADMYTSPVSVDISQLEEYTNYTISVTAINEVGNVSISAEVTQMTAIEGIILLYFDITGSAYPLGKWYGGLLFEFGSATLQ